ncbi:MAG TPA: DUF3857 domain-containing protein, partial [Chitinophagaceae bacterium]|nr:DUF3857 domain-containing protein [Chitinophagaceae bacterium]
MLKSKLAVFLILASLFCYGNDDYDALWTALNKNDRQGAKVLAEKAKRNSSKALDAYLTQLFLQTFEGKEDLIEGFIDQVRATGQDKSAYLYALWFNGAVLGQYGKKAKKHQFDLLNTLISDNTYNGSIRAAAHYVKALHHIFGNDFEKSKIEYKEIGGLANWQLVGPFENISGTGFYKQFGPESSPHATTKFVGSEDIEISWFTPAKMNNEGWMFTQSHIKQSTAIIYAQTFVYAPQDVDVLLNAGGSGSLKVWLNDGLIISESTPRVTELDYYKNRCTLKKGYNRVLVQLGYTENSSPNYIVRFTDINFNTIKGLSTTAEYQPYAKINDAVSSTPIKHFAEEFFEKKIEADPKNLINYLLLSQTYLRSLRTTEARRIIEKALQFAPENSLLRFELIQCLLKAQNRTLMLQEVERLRETDPECTVIYQIKLNELMQEEKYQQAEELLNKIIQFNGEDEDAIERRIKLLAKLNKLDELVKTIETAYKRYPEYPAFAELMFRLKKQGMNDSKGAINIYERYFKTAYNYELLVQLAQEYSAQGQTDKYLSILKSLHDRVGHDPRYSIELCDFYLKKQHYEKALDYVKEALQLSPYEGSYWNKLALVQEQMNKTAEAIDNYRKTIYYDKTNYEAQKKLLSLEKKIDLTSSLPQNDVYEMIRRAPTSNSEYDFTYLLDEKAVIVYDKGASEEFITYAVKIYDQEGIDTWKEHYLSYDSNVQNILVEKCETVKANGSKVPAERDDNHVVFTNLEPGDAVYVKYRLQNYTYGRLGKELWDKFIFNAFVPANVSRYTLIAPSNLELRHETINGTIKPVVQQIQNYKLYTWEMRNVEPVKSEPLMPSLSDAGVVLHVSTVKTWRDIANWYSDISYQDNANDFELNSLYSELFKDKKHMTDVEIARSIYQYIQKNIRYSSVSFRQSGLTPQPVAKTISTRLGDCKDLSSLFVALAEKAG